MEPIRAIPHVRAPVRRLPNHRYLWGLVVSLALACIVAIVEIDAQSQRIVDPTSGYAWPFAVLFGWRGDRAGAGWSDILPWPDDQTGTRLEFARLLTAHLWADWVFIACYLTVLCGFVVTLFRSPRARLLVIIVVAAAGLSDAVENLAAATLVDGSGDTGLLRIATRVKWLAVALVAALLLLRALIPRSDRRPRSARTLLGRLWRAGLHHRFSFAVVLPLLVLSVMAGHPILEQLPDVQRRWVADGRNGVGDAIWAILVVLLVSITLWFFGAIRTGYAQRLSRSSSGRRVGVGCTPALERPPIATTGGWFRELLRWLRRDLRRFYLACRHPRRTRTTSERSSASPEAALGVWLVGPAVALAMTLPVLLDRPDAPILGARLAIFCAVPLLIVGGSWILRRLWQIRTDWDRPYQPPRMDTSDLPIVAMVGNCAAIAVVVIGGLSLIRSYTSMAVLPVAEQSLRATPPAAGIWVFLALGVLAVVCPWLVAWRLGTGSRTAGVVRRLRRIAAREPRSPWRRWFLLVAVMASYLAVGLLPAAVGTIGVSAVATLSIALLVGIPAATGLVIQEPPTAEIFRLFGLHRTPLMTVFVSTIVAIGLVSGKGSIHQVQSNPAVGAVARQPLGDVVSTWALQSKACRVRVGDRMVRPMLLLAAEGGGIRAAYWTVKSLEALQRKTAAANDCGAHAALLSGGASGGSVGLTVARFTGTADAPDTSRALEAVKAMAAPDTLAQAAIGTFVRDPFYGATGVPLDADGKVPAGSWADRAQLIDLGWADAHPANEPTWGTRAFLTPADQLSPVPGHLVLNSSSVVGKCRVWVSQLDLGPARSGPPVAAAAEQSCDSDAAPAARTIDLFTAYGPLVSAPTADATCLANIPATTAALLTARFPYVTPGAVVGDCPRVSEDSRDLRPYWPRTQLVDGGYLENTGLATITDLSPEWLSQTREHNQRALSDPGMDLVVPMVVFLTNEEGVTTQPPEQRRPQSELLLPPLTVLGGAGSLNKAAALLQRAQSLVVPEAFCPLDAATKEVASQCRDASDRFPRRVIVVDRAAQPEVSTPLGWVLSDASMASMDRAMQRQVDTRCLDPVTRDEVSAPACSSGYATLGDLLSYLAPERR